jgi:phenylalanyl-tRNA synthetase beta chain
LEGVREKFQLSGIIYGRFSKASVHRRYDRSADFYVLKGVIEGLMTRLNVNNYSSAAVDDNPYGLSNASEILIGKDNIGYMGRVSPQFAKTIQSDVGPCYGFQFDLNALIEIAHEEPTYRSIVNYPVVERDLNFVMDESCPLGEVMDTIQKNGKNILIQSEPINIFRHESVGEGKKAIAINLVFQSTSKTLEDKDVNSVIDGIIKVVSNKFSAKLR